MKQNPITIYLHKPWLGQTILKEDACFHPLVEVEVEHTNILGKLTSVTKELQEDKDEDYTVTQINLLEKEYVVTLNYYSRQLGLFKEVTLRIPLQDGYVTREVGYCYEAGKKVMLASD